MWKSEKKFRAMVLIVGLLLSVAYVLHAGVSNAQEKFRWECWVVCEPDSFVMIRSQPNLHGRVVGWAYAGDRITADDLTEDGWVHSSDLLIEAGEGWICIDYLTDAQPRMTEGLICRVEANGRVAAREGIAGKRRAWLQPGTEVEVYMVAGEWAVTDKGYIAIEYLEPVK